MEFSSRMVTMRWRRVSIIRLPVTSSRSSTSSKYLLACACPEEGWTSGRIGTEYSRPAGTEANSRSGYRRAVSFPPKTAPCPMLTVLFSHSGSERACVRTQPMPCPGIRPPSCSGQVDRTHLSRRLFRPYRQNSRTAPDPRRAFPHEALRVQQPGGRHRVRSDSPSHREIRRPCCCPVSPEFNLRDRLFSPCLTWTCLPRSQRTSLTFMIARDAKRSPCRDHIANNAQRVEDSAARRSTTSRERPPYVPRNSTNTPHPKVTPALQVRSAPNPAFGAGFAIHRHSRASLRKCRTVPSDPSCCSRAAYGGFRHPRRHSECGRIESLRARAAEAPLQIRDLGGEQRGDQKSRSGRERLRSWHILSAALITMATAKQ